MAGRRGNTDLRSASRGSAKPAPMMLRAASVGAPLLAKPRWRDRSPLSFSGAPPRSLHYGRGVRTDATVRVSPGRGLCTGIACRGGRKPHAPRLRLTACGETPAAQFSRWGLGRRSIPAEPRRFAPLIVAFRSKYPRYSSLTRLVSRAPRPHREDWPGSALTRVSPQAVNSLWQNPRGVRRAMHPG